MSRDEATLRQIEAATPNVSTWLSANAGSGKTRVLTDRVARLLLSGVEPQHILCLTYTKAAASEMQNRLFKRLGAWAMQDADALRQELTDLGASGALDGDALAHARTLFARAIETPGGLKIQTIHSFCSALLRRFPLEAGVSVQFTEMEDRAGDLLRAEVLDDMANGPHRNALSMLARHYPTGDLDKLTAEIVKHHTVFLDGSGTAKIWDAFGLDPDYSIDQLRDEVFLGGEVDVINATVSAMRVSTATDQKNADHFARAASCDRSAMTVLEKFLLNGPKAQAGPYSAKIDKFPGKSGQAALGPMQDHLNALMLRVEDARKRRLSLDAAQRTEALYQFAVPFLSLYEGKKRARGWLDFDDLILKTRDLLTDKTVADWVLYRIDGGIDHVLVDEAQDTSPAQWDVVKKLTQELTAGEGARTDVTRSIFVVGDKKQSIYSFQGADPRAFDEMEHHFAERLQQSETPLTSLELEYSFRSSQAVLNSVDLTFSTEDSAGFAGGSTHKAFKADMPGRVDMWPVIEEVKDADPPHWDDPVDVLGQDHHMVRLARRIAEQIKTMIDTRTALPQEIGHTGTFDERPVRPGDFLILVQRRGALFEEIIRACKEADLPIAGADRLKVGAEIAVRDIAALLAFLATPEDDLSLAVALKSPLFGWDEKRLYGLAQNRGGKFLWTALREQAETYAAEIDILNDLRQNADFLRPYDLIERVLTRHKGRAQFLGRLGAEAEDGIDALLSQALSYERSSVPSLTGFLNWLASDDLEIKRQMEGSGDRIRVMTVHGSKGLEAPIVILPDTAKRAFRNQNVLLDMKGTISWVMAEDVAPPAIAAAKATEQDLQREERNRLLYVAMTRAEKWLIVAAAGDLGKTSQDSWYGQMQSALPTAGAETFDFGFGEGLRLEHGAWSETAIATDLPTDRETLVVPALFDKPAPEPAIKAPALSPSTDLGGPKALPSESGLSEEEAKARGTAVHLLLEHFSALPEDDWETAAQTLIRERADIAALIAEARGVMHAPDLQFLRSEDALSEVPISAAIPEFDGRRVHGIIDRLVVSETDVWAIDFKTNIAVPRKPESCPDGLVRQMASYRVMLQQLYPDHRIRAGIVWTRTAQLMELAPEHMTAALSRVLLP